MVSSGQLSPAPLGTAATAPAEIDTVALGDLASDPRWRRPVLLGKDLLVLTTGGHGTAELDFRALPCRPGTLLRVRAGQVLRCAGPQLDATVVRWEAAALRGVDVDPDAIPARIQLAGEDEDAVITEVSQLVVDCQRHQGVAAARGLLRHQLAVLLLRLSLLPGCDHRATRAEAATFHRLCREVERGYQHTRRVEDYAARLDCSVRTLTRACLAVTGRSAKQVVDERVALQASRLLAATDEPIARIGRRLGFSEPTNFGRFFTREVGVSPGVFRAAREQPVPGPVVRPRPPADATGRPRGA
ncbi:AraC family transcriptional regulator [Micromonospora peucetia]|uniref:AraC family transcriptional regulator n=1 Tax=Micromonospora peucetia TaxID=47871 RepID=A0A1C6TZG7_9ACTN|nr:AraC family transcriptional regulator [Micromonospora peucetia]MCX4385801.1 AraC family transcriptional regulator [Micromonospora peucetia]WSA33186.1 AraC family transcriptional regulator [Micromonospora peucetia]SCL47230.1 transcriptional regulator, AraC family [Micromonospora peucetia]